MKILKSDKITTLFMISFIGAIILHYAVIVQGYLQALPGFVDPLLAPWFVCGLVMWMIAGSVQWIMNMKNRLKYRRSPCKQDAQNINDTDRVVIPVANLTSILMTCVFALIAIPHIYASYKIEPVWKEWKQTHNNDLFVERDRILHSLGFDHSTSLRFWEGPIPGLYIPELYLEAIGVRQNKVFLPDDPRW